MSLYYEAADILTAPTDAGGSLKSRIFSKKDLKSQPAQIYALAIETCKWSPVLKEIIEFSDILRLERKLTPVLSLLLVHDLLLAKRGIALPATHGLRTATERHKGRLQAEFTKARIRRKLSTVEAFKTHVETGQENAADDSEVPYPRWVRINTLKTSLDDQLDTTFNGYERAISVDAVRQRGTKRIFLDATIPNLVAISPHVDLSKSEAYKSGAIIFQDKASCFPAYLLDPLTEDGDIIDTCSAPGNKTTHIAAILLSHNSEPDECTQTIHAFEKNKGRAETLDKMVNLAGSNAWTKLHPGQDFLKTNPSDQMYKNVGALLLDPSCSGSGIIGRDEMPELHLPAVGSATVGGRKGSKNTKTNNASKDSRKRKREEPDELEVLVDDDGVETVVNNEDELKTRLAALSSFQLELLLHAFKFPAARKITYSTCSIHTEENEVVVKKALDSAIAKERGWRILKREDQIRGLREWRVRGSLDECDDDTVLAESCIRANKGDEHGTMGFFVAGFVRDHEVPTQQLDAEFLRDERGHLVRDLLGMPVRVHSGDSPRERELEATAEHEHKDEKPPDDEEWEGFKDDEPELEEVLVQSIAPTESHIQKQTKGPQASKHSYSAVKKRPALMTKDKKRKSKK